MPRDLRTLPKSNLHLHLTGSMRPDTLAELAGRYGRPVPPPLPSGRANGWPAFQERYDAARAALRTAEDLARVAGEAVDDGVADGCGWVELQVDPTSYAPLLGGLEPVVEAVLAGVRGRPAGVIVAASWASPGEQALALAKLAARYAGHGVVGFGLSNDERRGRVFNFAAAFAHATDAGLLAAPHSGFYTGAGHVRTCVEVLGAGRIGHGITAARDADTLAILADRRVTLEVCPTSYPPFGVAELSTLPIRALRDAGVPVALASDDPLLFGADVTDQYRLVRDHLGLADADLAALAAASVSASTAPAGLKERLHRDIDAWLADPDPG